MEMKLKVTLDEIANNRNIYKSLMTWETASSYTAIMAAFLATAEKKPVDAVRYREAQKILRANASAFSQFRGYGRGFVITKMALADDPESYLAGVMSIYRKMRELHKLTSSPYMLLAAITLYENGGEEKADENIEKWENLYKELHEQHPLLVTVHDRSYIAMLVAYAQNCAALPEEIENCYQACKHYSHSKDAVNSLAQIMALSAKPVEEKSQIVAQLIKGLKAKGAKLDRSVGFASVGALTLIDVPADTLIEEVAEAYKYLRSKKGFSFWSVDRRYIASYAILAVFMSHADSAVGFAEGISTTLAMDMVEEIVMSICVMATISASATAAASSASN